MTIKIQKGKRYKIPNQRIKEIEQLKDNQIKEIDMINQMSNEEYREYIFNELNKSKGEIKRGEFVTLEKAIQEIDNEIDEDEKERKNYKKWMELIKRKRTYAL